jgi:hypothetical protein
MRSTSLTRPGENAILPEALHYPQRRRPQPARARPRAKFNAARITVSTVVINPHDNSGAQSMFRIAKQHKGKFYNVTDPKKLPNIFLKEAATVSRSAIIENPFTPRVESPSPIIKGIDSVPKLLGYVGTSPKPPSAGTRVVLSSGEGDPGSRHAPVWLGKSVAWTSDARQRWSAAWLGWSGFLQVLGADRALEYAPEFGKRLCKRWSTSIRARQNHGRSR